MSDVTRILSAIELGDPQAAEQLLPLVYEELRRLAAHKVVQESPEHSLQATELVHEAYLRLVGNDTASNWNSRGHFFAAAAEAMRRILIENARRKQTIKHGGQMCRQSLDLIAPATYTEPNEELLVLDEALKKLAERDATKAKLVELRYFGGLTIQQTAQVLGISTTTAERYWNYARAWLHREISKDDK